MKLSDLAADLMVTLYGWNRRTMKFRGGYRALIMASNLLPRLRAYPIHFRETGTIEVDVKFPDTYWLLNEYVGDPHKSLVFLRRVAEAVVKPRDVIWDVGANMGFISWHLAQSRYQLNALHLFEPNPVPFQISKRLLGDNSVVHFHNCGLGKTSGTAMLADSGDGGTGSGSMRKSAVNSFISQIECAVETGDEIVNRGDAEAPDFIKIDVEGFEREVIEGLSRTIAQKKPVICFEFIFLTQTEIEGLIPQGYRLAYISGVDGNLIENYDRAMQERAMDVVIAPVESLLWSLIKEK